MKKLYYFVSTIILIFAAWAMLGGGGDTAYADDDGHTHFRYGLYSWSSVGGNTIEFELQNAWRRTAYSTGNGRCIDLATLGSIACSEPDGFAGVGDVVVEFQGFTLFDPGDGSPSVGSPLGPLMYLVTSIDPANNWLFGLALDPSSFPAVDATISHTYAAVGDYLAFTDSCCRISPLVAGNAHINNPDGGYRVETIVNVGSGNRPPVSATAPIVNCPINAVCSFLIQAADPDGENLSFRLSTSAEASSFSGFNQPGPPNAPNSATIDPNTGLYTWDTTGATLGPIGFNTLYSTQVTIEDGSSKVALDFLIQLVEEDPNPPIIQPPPNQPPICETTQVVSVDNNLAFDVIASDPDVDDTVTLNVVNLPVSASMTPGLPLAGNPVASLFSWTPAIDQVGFHVVVFFASSTGGGFTQCSVTLEVIEEIQVEIDIKPGSDPNCFNNNGSGVIPVAVLGSAEFDVSEIDPSSVKLAGLDLRAVGKSNKLLAHIEDVNNDGFDDLVVQIEDQNGTFMSGNSTAELTGTLFSGTPIKGTDEICVVP